MIRIFLLLLLCVAGTWYLADAIRQEGPGYVYIAFGQYSLETSVWVGLLLLLALVVFLYFGFRLTLFLFRNVLRLDTLPRRLLAIRARKLHNQGEIAFLNQQWQLAGSKLGKAARNSDTPFLDYLMAGRAALWAKDIKTTEHFLAMAKDAPNVDARALALLELDLELARSGQEKKNLLLEEWMREKGKTAEILTRAVQHYIASEQWSKLFPLLSVIRKHHVVEDQDWHELQAQTLAGMMDTVSNAEQKKELRQWWKRAGKENAHNRVIKAYCAALQRLGESPASRKLLETRLQQEYSDILLEQYATLLVDDKEQWLGFAEKFLPSQKGSWRLLVALGSMSATCGFHARARDYLQRSITIKPTARAYELLADIASVQKDAGQAQACLRKALSLAQQATLLPSANVQ